MSQRDVADVSFETWVRDLETIVDAAGLDRFPLLGISRGGPIAIAYAVKHPERVTHLVLYGAFAVGMKRVGTGRTCRFIPEASPQQEQWFDELQRVSTSPENAARLMELDGDIDVRPLLSQVETPTLVIHCDRDHAVLPERVACSRLRSPVRGTSRCRAPITWCWRRSPPGPYSSRSWVYFSTGRAARRLAHGLSVRDLTPQFT